MSEQSKVKKLPSRSEIKVEDTWKLRIFLLQMTHGKKNLKKKSSDSAKEKFKGKLEESAQTLYDALQRDESQCA